ncbi:MAG: universal stress protein [Salinivirgaceae bacterium]|jgi:nucleotide-binding universal stress UspA family protein|nr:universal stress protein [Salinivirgaceae bacterium]MDD4747430.1 universal stress protein [Salinivirgaceae bacterium]
MNHAIFKILVPIDFSEQSYSGLRQAKYMAEGRAVKIVALHVIREHSSPWNVFTSEEKNVFVEKTHDKLRLLADMENINREQFSTRIEFGKLCDTILDISAEMNVDCIIMGTSAANNIKKKIIGSNALRVVSEAHVPVITVKSNCEIDNFENIYLPLDLNKETREKVPLAIKIAKLLDSRIKVVSFVSTKDELVNSNLKRQAQLVRDFVMERGVDCTAEVLFFESGSRKEKMVEYMNNNPGMAIITTHQQPEIVDFLLGSFAADVIHLSQTPVMSIIPIGVIKYGNEMPGIR